IEVRDQGIARLGLWLRMPGRRGWNRSRRTHRLLCLLLRFIVQRSDVTRHFQAGQQLSVTRIAAHCCFFVQAVLSVGEKLDHCLASSSRIACSLSRQFLFSTAMLGSRNETPPCCAIPSQTCSTSSDGTLSTTGMTRLAPRSSAGGNIMAKLRHPIDC